MMIMIRSSLAIISLLLITNIAESAEPVQIIFDTDISGDVDDVLALAMLHALADRGECNLLAVTISKMNPLTGPFTDATNTFYGRANIPIGITQKAQRRESKYLKLINEKQGDQFRYPHDVLSNAQLPTAVEVLRKTLASAADHSVVIIQVGLAANLAELIDSKSDQFSDLNGLQLIRRKVKMVSVMAGSFEPIDGNQRFLEANIRNGIQSMQRFTTGWPNDVPVIWSGFEIGIAVKYPRRSIAHDFNYVRHHIVREAYLLHSGPEHDRPSWDLTSVLYAVRPHDNYFDLSQPGRVSVADDGYTSFKPGENGRDRYLVMNSVQAARVREALRYLVSQPPLHFSSQKEKSPAK